MKNLAEMYAFSSKLWYDKRWVSKTGEASLYLQVTVNGKHKEFPLKLKWPVNKIDLDAGALMPRKKGDPEVQDYNMTIAMEQSNHTQILRTYRIKQAPIDIKKFALEVKIYDQKTSFAAYMRREITTRYARKEITERTWLNHGNAYNLMVEFDCAWPFNALSVDWMKKFKMFMSNKCYRPGVRYQASHIWTILKTVKTYLQFALLEPMLHVDKEVADFPNPEPKWKTTFLNKDELRRLMEVYRAKNITDKQLRVLAAFLFTCFTSLRISDVYRVNSFWRLNDNFLDFIPKKNEKKGKWVHVPLVPMAIQFIQHNAGRFFELPNEGEYNLTLKDLAVIARINKKLTSHVGRHTFGYLYMTTAGNLAGLKEIMGHSKVETTMRYAHLDDEYSYQSTLLIQDKFSDMLMKKVDDEIGVM